MTFSELEVGKEFFDPYSGEDFVKISESTGRALLTEEEDEFQPDQEVEV